MSYNGIGLASVRGSGTSGYVQTNKFHLKASRMGPRDQGGREELQGGMRKPNKEILEHNRRRALEVKLLELRDKLESEGCVCHLRCQHSTGLQSAVSEATRGSAGSVEILTLCLVRP